MSSTDVFFLLSAVIDGPAIQATQRSFDPWVHALTAAESPPGSTSSEHVQSCFPFQRLNSSTPCSQALASGVWTDNPPHLRHLLAHQRPPHPPRFCSHDAGDGDCCCRTVCQLRSGWLYRAAQKGFERMIERSSSSGFGRVIGGVGARHCSYRCRCDWPGWRQGPLPAVAEQLHSSTCASPHPAHSGHSHTNTAKTSLRRTNKSGARYRTSSSALCIPSVSYLSHSYQIEPTTAEIASNNLTSRRTRCTA
jgi:hypothetical protein